MSENDVTVLVVVHDKAANHEVIVVQPRLQYMITGGWCLAFIAFWP